MKPASSQAPCISLMAVTPFSKRGKIMSKFLLSLGSGLLLTFSVFSTGVASATKVDGTSQTHSAAEHASADASVLPRAQAPFQGKIGRTYKDSEPDWPRPVQAPEGSPNVLLVLTDDVG